MNTIKLSGNLGNDPEILKGSKGDFVVFRIAQNFEIEDVKYTDWYSIYCFKKAMTEAQTLKKGDLVVISGNVKPFIREINDKKIESLRIIANSVEKKEKLKSEKKFYDEMPDFSSGVELL